MNALDGVGFLFSNDWMSRTSGSRALSAILGVEVQEPPEACLEALARTVDSRELAYAFPQKSDVVFNRGEVQDAARDWARLVTRRLGDVQKL